MITIPEVKLSKDYVKISKDNLINFTNISGLYFFYNVDKELVYLGKSKDIKGRVLSHYKKQAHTSHIAHNFYYFKYMIIEDVADREIYETYYINLLKPKLNSSKVYSYQSEVHNSKYHSEEHIKERELIQEKLFEVYMNLNL